MTLHDDIEQAIGEGRTLLTGEYTREFWALVSVAIDGTPSVEIVTDKDDATARYAELTERVNAGTLRSGCTQPFTMTLTPGRSA